jgi:DNA-binding NarL/FixJ family response regulator
MRLFIADMNSTVRLALQMYLQQEPGLYVTGMASEAEGLPAQVEASRPDVLLLDSHLPGASMQDLLTDIRGLESPPKIVVLSIKPEEKGLALSAGADAFINKNAPPEELLEVVRSLRETTVNSTE